MKQLLIVVITQNAKESKAHEKKFSRLMNKLKLNIFSFHPHFVIDKFIALR